jgi:hypothetical protein
MTKARTNKAMPTAPTGTAWLDPAAVTVTWMSSCQSAALAWIGAWTKVANAMVETGSIQAEALRAAAARAAAKPEGSGWRAGAQTVLREELMLVGEQAERTAGAVGLTLAEFGLDEGPVFRLPD